MASLELPDVVWLNASDRPAIDAFTCDRGASWSEAIEVMVQDGLANALVEGLRQAFGIWNGAQLAAVAVFHTLTLMTPPTLRLLVLATTPGCARRGYGKVLMDAVQVRARLDGCSRISGLVATGNREMLGLLDTYDAVVFRREADDEHLGFVIAL